MKKKAGMAERIKNLQGVRTQAEFAKDLGVPQSRVSEYLGGKRPTAEMCVRLAKLAKYPDNLWFLEQAGLTHDAILSAAEKILTELTAPPAEGEIIRISRFRETDRGREEAGAPIAIPREFVPHPNRTICLSVDEAATGIADSPKGIVILDTSWEGAEDLSQLWGRVVMLRYAPKYPSTNFPTGIYAGRLWLNVESARIWRDRDNIRIPVWLEMLTAEVGGGPTALSLGQYIDPKSMKGIPLDDHNAADRRWREIQKCAASDFRLDTGVSVLGKVIGRLTGHLEKGKK